MSRTMNVWIVIVVCACVLMAFFWQSNQFSDTLEELKGVSGANTVRLSDLEEENLDLTATLDMAGTDAYTESVARLQYGYMMPDEIRFVISDLELENEIPDE